MTNKIIKQIKAGSNERMIIYVDKSSKFKIGQWVRIEEVE